MATIKTKPKRGKGTTNNVEKLKHCSTVGKNIK
jgi:hypothetical protein